jgi:cell wall assembly regulator SMI1
MNIKQKLEKIAEWGNKNYEEGVNDFNKITDTISLHKIENLISEKLPKEIFDLYSEVNGQKDRHDGVLFGLQFLSTNEILEYLEFPLSLVKPLNREIEKPDESNIILNKIVSCCIDSAPVNFMNKLFKKWKFICFKFSQGSFSEPKIFFKEFQNGKGFEFKDSDGLFSLITELHDLEKFKYNWDSIELKIYPNKKFDISRLDYIWEDHINFRSFPENAIKKKYFHYKWIPIFFDYGGNHIGIDLDPDITGKKGQVIIYGREEEDMVVLSNSLNSFFDLCLEEIENTPQQFITNTHMHEVLKKIKDATNT